MASQREIVVSAVMEVGGNSLPKRLTNKQLQQVRTKFIEKLKNEPSWTSALPAPQMERYSSGVITNWLRKDEKLNKIKVPKNIWGFRAQPLPPKDDNEIGVKVEKSKSGVTLKLSNLPPDLQVFFKR